MDLSPNHPVDSAEMEQAQMEQAQIERAQQEIARLFQNFEEEIPIFLFAQPGINDVFADAARQAIRFFRQMTDKITVREYDLSHELAMEWGIHSSPTIVLAPEKYNVKWLGAPLGEEGRIFLEALLLIGSGDSQLNPQALQVVQRIDQPRNIKVFVSASCPYCPQQALNTLKAAIENPQHISLEIIDI